MDRLQARLFATEQKLAEFKAAQKAEAKVRRKAIKLSRAERARKMMLVGEAVLRRLEAGNGARPSLTG
jgi:hypothetical protein